MISVARAPRSRLCLFLQRAYRLRALCLVGVAELVPHLSHAELGLHLLLALLSDALGENSVLDTADRDPARGVWGACLQPLPPPKEGATLGRSVPGDRGGGESLLARQLCETL